MTSRYVQGIVRTDVPPLPGASGKFTGSTFPTAAPAANRSAAQGVVDDTGMLTLTHNSATASLTFQLYVWSDPVGWWMPFGSPVSIAQYALAVMGKLSPGVPFYIAASAGLGSSSVFIGGLTDQGTNYTKSA